MKSLGQAAVEYLITTSFLLMVAAIIFAYAMFVYNDSAATSAATGVVTTIVSTVDQVYVLGPETILYNEVSIPANVHDLRIENSATGKSQLVLELKTSAGITQITRTASSVFVWGGTPNSLNQLKQAGRYPIRVFSLPTPNQPYPRVCLSDGRGGCQ